MAVPAFVKELVTSPGTSNKTAGTTLAATIAATSAGNLIVAAVVFDNAATASKPIVSSISKAAGETATWASLGAARSTSTSAGAFASGELWCIRTTVAWASQSITLTLDTSTVMKSINFFEFSGVEATPRSTAGSAYSTTTTAASATTTGTTPQVNDLVLGLTFQSNSATVPTTDADTTGGSWVLTGSAGSTGGSGTTNNIGALQHKILTAASQQTLNAAGTVTAGNGSIVAILQAVLDPAITQASYRLYADGTESGSTALAAQDTAYTANVDAGDVNLLLRTRLQLTNAGVINATDDWQLQVEKNASGTWDLMGFQVNVVPFNSANLTDGAATTNRLGAGTGGFVAGKVSEDGTVDDLSWTVNNYTEVLYSLTLNSAVLANADTLRFRVLRNGATTGLTYTQTPTVSITKTVAASTGKFKVWTGSAWVEKPAKYWTGSAWVEKPLKVWSGSAWVLA